MKQHPADPAQNAEGSKHEKNLIMRMAGACGNMLLQKEFQWLILYKSIFKRLSSYSGQRMICNHIYCPFPEDCSFIVCHASSKAVNAVTEEKKSTCNDTDKPGNKEYSAEFFRKITEKQKNRHSKNRKKTCRRPAVKKISKPDKSRNTA